MAGVAISDREGFRRGAALAAAVVVHALLIAAWSQLIAKRKPPAAPAQERRSLLVLLDLEVQKRASTDEVRATPPSPQQERDERESTAITLPPSAPPPSASEARTSPRIDWALEAERSARATVEETARPGPRNFGPRDAPAPAPKPPEFDWAPEQSGFSGGLPYVRLGKRCVVGLGFFGCAVGELPEPNGELFEGMRDPNRHDSSVPDPPK